MGWKLWNPRKWLHPEEVTFLDTFPEPPWGWEQRKIFSLGITDRALIDLPEGASRCAREARAFFYPGFHPPYYPHIICLDDRDCLEFLVQAVFSSKGMILNGDEGRISRHIRELVRPTWGYVHRSNNYVIPPTDSRALWPGRDHVADMSKVPRAVRPLTKKIFWELLREDRDCFLASLGHTSA